MEIFARFNDNYFSQIRNNFWDIDEKLPNINFSEHLFMYCYLQTMRLYSFSTMDTLVVLTTIDALDSMLPFSKNKNKDKRKAKIKEILLNLSLTGHIVIEYDDEKMEYGTLLSIRIFLLSIEENKRTKEGYEEIPWEVIERCLTFNDNRKIIDIDTDEFAIMCYIKKKDYEKNGKVYARSQELTYAEIASNVGFSKRKVEDKIKESKNIITYSNGWQPDKHMIRKPNTFKIGDNDQEDVLSKISQIRRWSDTNVNLNVQDFMCYLKNRDEHLDYDEVCHKRLYVRMESSERARKVRSDLMKQAKEHMYTGTRTWREIPDWSEEEQEGEEVIEEEAKQENESEVKEEETLETEPVIPLYIPKTKREIEKEEEQERTRRIAEGEPLTLDEKKENEQEKRMRIAKEKMNEFITVFDLQ